MRVHIPQKDHSVYYLVRTRTFPGYWGRSTTVQGAVDQMPAGLDNAELDLFVDVPPDAYVESIRGGVVGAEPQEPGTVHTDSEGDVIRIDHSDDTLEREHRAMMYGPEHALPYHYPFLGNDVPDQ